MQVELTQEIRTGAEIHLSHDERRMLIQLLDNRLNAMPGPSGSELVFADELRRSLNA